MFDVDNLKYNYISMGPLALLCYNNLPTRNKHNYNNLFLSTCNILDTIHEVAGVNVYRNVYLAPKLFTIIATNHGMIGLQSSKMDNE